LLNAVWLKSRLEMGIQGSLLRFGIVLVKLGHKLRASRPHLHKTKVPLEPVPVLSLYGWLPSQIGLCGVGYGRVKVAQLPFSVGHLGQVVSPILFDIFNMSITVSGYRHILAFVYIRLVDTKRIHEGVFSTALPPLETGVLVEALDGIPRHNPNFDVKLFTVLTEQIFLTPYFWLAHKSQGLTLASFNTRESHIVCLGNLKQLFGVLLKLGCVFGNVYAFHVS